MKFENAALFAIKAFLIATRLKETSLVLLLVFAASLASYSQAVTEIITDFNGYWKSTAATPNSIKPDKSHNLLAFRYNNILYSTGVNNELLASNGETFQVEDFWCLPVSGLTGAITGNTKVGLGALYDGVTGGSGTPAPEWGIERYLTDGIKGLDLGTCIANLPVGTMWFSVANIQAASIGDGIPDILVTQIADPSGSFDRYEFTDANGVRVGNYKDIVFTNIAPVGTWTADFYNAAQNPLTLSGGFTQTDRTLRLWAADLSDFGITAANCGQIRNFQINLCGNSDVAFVAYNNTAINLQDPLPVQYSFFSATAFQGKIKLDWQTTSEQNTAKFIVERSADGISFVSISSVPAKNQAHNTYSFLDNNPLKGKNYYRLKQVDSNGDFKISPVIIARNAPKNKLNLYPNPAKDVLYLEHEKATGNEILYLSNAAGITLKQVSVSKNEEVSKLTLAGLPAGTYFISYQTKNEKQVSTFVVR